MTTAAYPVVDDCDVLVLLVHYVENLGPEVGGMLTVSLQCNGYI